MRALVVTPGRSGSTRVEDVGDLGDGGHAGELLVDGLAVGICGTDHEIVGGRYGTAPPGSDRLVLGHESLGRVRSAPEDSGFAVGDHVVGIVRRPDPVPCGACAHDEWDMCRNGRFTERGIKDCDGYAVERWSVPPEFAVRVDPQLGVCGVLLEPTSVVAKAWEQVERIGGRAWFEPRTVLVTGAGPIGMLAALLGVQRGLEVHVLDVVATGPKPDLVRALGATYHHEGLDRVTERLRPDVVLEATGVGRLVLDVLEATASYGIVCLTGVSSGGRSIGVDAGAVNREIVLENDAVVGSVNANRRHYAAAADALGRADRDWLRRLITRVVPLDDHAAAFERRDGDIKTVLAISPDLDA